MEKTLNKRNQAELDAVKAELEDRLENYCRVIQKNETLTGLLKA